MTRRRWTQRERSILRMRYPNEQTADIARDLGRPTSQVYNAAHYMGLKKTAEFYRSDKSGRIQRGRTDPRMKATQFKTNHRTWNKGKKGWQAGGRAQETQFKKGRPPSAARNYRPIGSLRISEDGYLERKTTDRRDIYPSRRWCAVHRLVWQAENGPIPDGHIVVFRQGQLINVESEITVDRLECISRVELMRRNTYHNYPKEVALAIQLRGALTRQINKRAKQHAE